MIILAIESSCDETAAAILKDGELLSNIVVSQIDIFKSYGGVIPEVAARSHLEAILPVIDKALADAKVTWNDITHIAVTHTPGLLGSLLIGTLTARILAVVHNKPLYAVHHLKSHIYSNWIKKVSENSSDAPKFPLLALVISGGHTQIIYMKEHNSFAIIGTTLDDAIGECFDKVAKILGLPYPGGPSVANAAKNGNPNKYRFPHPKVDSLNFSFSGLKTAVLRAVQKECGVAINYPSHELKTLLNQEQIADFAASFEKTAIDILLEKLSIALEKYHEVHSIVFAGGVSANENLRKAATIWSESNGSFAAAKENPRIFGGAHERSQSMAGTTQIALRSARLDNDKNQTGFSQAKKNPPDSTLKVFFPEKPLSGDNAAMVAMAAYYEIQAGVKPTDPYALDISPRSDISKN